MFLKGSIVAVLPQDSMRLLMSLSNKGSAEVQSAFGYVSDRKRSPTNHLSAYSCSKGWKSVCWTKIHLLECFLRLEYLSDLAPNQISVGLKLALEIWEWIQWLLTAPMRILYPSMKSKLFVSKKVLRASSPRNATTSCLKWKRISEAWCTSMYLALTWRTLNLKWGSVPLKLLRMKSYRLVKKVQAVNTGKPPSLRIEPDFEEAIEL